MDIVKKLCFSLLWMLCFSSLQAQTCQDSLTFKLDEYFNALTEINQFNGNVLVEKDDSILLEKTYNMNNVPKEMSVFRNSRFIIASVSKLFIKYSILKLSELDKLKLSDPLSKFIPDFPNGKSITLEHLLNHQSGLPRELKENGINTEISLENIVPLSRQESLLFEPGTQTQYSNVGYCILHYIINVCSDEGYYAFIDEEIFKGMNLYQTAEYSTKKRHSNLAPGYEKKKGEVVKVPLDLNHKSETGNYVSSLEDLYKFSKQLELEFTTHSMIGEYMFKKESCIIQAGGRPGYRAYYYQNLKTKRTFIFLANYSDIPVQEISDAIVNIMECKPYVMPENQTKNEIKVAMETLQKYTGKFMLEADQKQIFEVKIKNEQIIIVNTDGESSVLLPYAENAFFEQPNSDDTYSFIKNTETNVYDLIIRTEGINLKAKRVE
jgi:CubicO group peptidase (beta-lactamase class C family)